MKVQARELEKLERLLRQAYREKKPVEVDPHWQKRLMARIREAGAPQEGPQFLPMFEHLVWKLAPVTTPLAIVLVVVLVTLAFGNGYDIYQLMANSVEELTLAQIFAT